jgi:hypothetical protein
LTDTAPDEVPGYAEHARWARGVFPAATDEHIGRRWEKQNVTERAGWAAVAAGARETDVARETRHGKEKRMSERFKSRAAVADKIGWEGGILEALEYGIHAADMPEGDAALAAAWTALEDAFSALQPLAAAVGDLLEAPEPRATGDGSEAE